MGSLGYSWEGELQGFREAKRPRFLEKEGLAFFLEPIKPEDVLYLFGAGHVSTFIAPLAKMVGFRVIVIDDREEFANQERFPNADEILVLPFEESFDRISISKTSYVSIITRGHIHDKAVLAAALSREPAYIGMIGSRRKRLDPS